MYHRSTSFLFLARLLQMLSLTVNNKNMKKLIVFGLGLSLCAVTLTSKAQNSSSDVKLGLKAGVNLMTGGEYNLLGTYISSSYQPGFQVGAFMDFPLSSQVAMAPEILYSQKNAKFTETIAGAKGEIKTNLGYIDVPVLLKFNASPQFNVVVGPQASFLVSHKTTTSADGNVLATNEDKKDINKSIFGGVLGVGYTVTPNIGINARYMMDFQKVAKEVTQQDKAKLSGFALSIGYNF